MAALGAGKNKNMWRFLKLVKLALVFTFLRADHLVALQAAVLVRA